MKTLIVFFIILLQLTAAGQSAKFGTLKNGSFNNYTTASGIVLSLGDTLTIGTPTADLGFKYISQGNTMAATHLAGNTAVIDKLKTYGNKKRGFKMYAHVKGWGLVPVLIDIEAALKTNEIVKPL